MIGKTILHYKILEKLGGGGMGVVYKALDEKLDRIVALKFLPEHLLDDSEAEQRFISEAKAASSLDHPNICTIYDIDHTDDNKLFIAMAYYDGETLKKKIGHGKLPIEESINIVTQVADGLNRAHQNGITHRDINPANIMITKYGEVKIVDFGLAKSKASAGLTNFGLTVGTAAYMSPEQTRGESVDGRTDIWALGIILYEMITGVAPFKGEYYQAIIYSILNDELTDIDGIPEELKRIISKATAKNPPERYQNISEMHSDLLLLKGDSEPHSSSGHRKPEPKKSYPNKKWIWVSASLFVVILIVAYFYFNQSNIGLEEAENTRQMIVVLPFENLGASEDDYFADGLTGEITSKLSGLSGLGVIARSSAMQYKKTTKSIQQIGEELGVQYVLEGTVQWEELPDGKTRIRVNPELINVENVTQMWSKPYEEEFSSAFTLQSKIASTVAEAMNLKLLISEQNNLQNTITNNPEAYNLYLKGVYFLQDISNEKNQRIAEEMLEKAIELDSNFAEAYARQSTVQSNLYWFYFDRSKENLRKSEVNAKKALLINDELPEGHVAMGNYFYHGILDYESALSEYRKALKLNPNHIDAIIGIAFVLRRQGKMEETIEYLMKTFKLNPRDYQTLYYLGETYTLIRQYKKGIQFLDKANLLAPDAILPYYTEAMNFLLENGDTKKAREVIQKALDSKIGLDEHSFSNTLYLCNIFDGNYSGALKIINGIEEADDQFYYKPEDLYKAELYDFMKNKKLAEHHYKSAIKILSEKIKQHPDDSRLYSSLGICYAGIGEKEKAIKEGRHGYELLPVTKEAWRGTFRLYDLAVIYTMVGEQELALDAIEDLLNRPTDAISVALLKLDPTWNTLRGNPRFQKLIRDIK